MINTYIPYLKKKDRHILSKCIATNYVSTAGPLISKFEDKFKSYYQFKYAIALNSGTSALHIGLKAIGVKKGDTVILPTYSFAATANSIIYNNAMPWFFDCDNDFNLSIENIEKVLKKKTIKKKNNLVLKENNSIVRAIVPVSTFGKKLEIRKLTNFSKKYNLSVLFDVAASHDPKIFNIKKSNKMHFCFSFNGNKTLTTGAGGILATNSKNIISRAQVLANVGKKTKKYDYQEIGFNYKMTNLQAALGLSQLDNLKKILNIKKNIFRKYFQKFKNHKKLNIIYSSTYQNWVFVVILESKKKFMDLKKKFVKARIQLDYFLKPLHLQKPYKKFLKENLKFSEKIWNKVVVLPSHPGLKAQDQSKIIKIINSSVK